MLVAVARVAETLCRCESAQEKEGLKTFIGQRYNADELLEDVTGARLQMVSVADRIREVLPSNGSR